MVAHHRRGLPGNGPGDIEARVERAAGRAARVSRDGPAVERARARSHVVSRPTPLVELRSRRAPGVPRSTAHDRRWRAGVRRSPVSTTVACACLLACRDCSMRSASLARLARHIDRSSSSASPTVSSRIGSVSNPSWPAVSPSVGFFTYSQTSDRPKSHTSAVRLSLSPRRAFRRAWACLTVRLGHHTSVVLPHDLRACGSGGCC